MAEKKTEEAADIVARVFSGEVATDETFEFDGPSGYESVDKDCVTIPFLKIAQSSTEEAKRGSAKRIDGLEPGMFFCPATRKVYGETMNLVILRFYRQFVVYESEETDAKFLGTISPEAFKAQIEPSATRVRSYHVDADGHRYVDTRNFIVMNTASVTDGPMLLSLSSTGIAPSRKWLTQAQNVRAPDGRVAPIWANVWNLANGYVDNPLGSYYQISRVERMGFVSNTIKELVVRAFLDAQGLEKESLDKSAQGHAAKDGEPEVF